MCVCVCCLCAGGGSIDADEFCDWFLEEEELNKGKTARTVGVGPNSPRLSERSPRASKDDSEFGLDGDTTAMLSAGGEEVSMATLRADFIELDRIASKMQKESTHAIPTATWFPPRLSLRDCFAITTTGLRKGDEDGGEEDAYH